MTTVRVLHQIGDRALGGNFNTFEEFLACKDPIHFDGVYTSVYDALMTATEAQREDILKKDVTLFMSGAYLGKTNAFDLGQPVSRFCALQGINYLANRFNFKLGWHGKRHRRCTGMDPISVQEEIELPRWWPPTAVPILAWPFGDFDDTAKKVAERLGFTEAWATERGDGSRFAKKRLPLNW